MGVADVLVTLDQFEKDRDYLESHIDEWLAEYGTCWVVVHDGQLVARASTLPEALASAREGAGAACFAYELLTSEPYNMIL